MTIASDTTPNNPLSATLLMVCPDQKGIVAAVTSFLSKYNGNILDLDEHVDRAEKTFFMRIEWDLSHFSVQREDIHAAVEKEIGTPYKMEWSLYFSDERPRAAIFVSKLSHCLYDILSRCQFNEWRIETPLIISNHPDLEPIAKQFGADFEYIPINKENKKAQEKKELELLKKYNIDFIILARYMQILSADFVKHYPNKIINIHHSFLPAFPGRKPYHSAYERGVKIIGVTSHYVTADLDAGPIIEQDVAPVSHKDTAEDMIRIGRDLEKVILSRAIFHHLQRKVLVHRNKTIVFV